MSLNRCEDAFLRYLQTRPDEQRFWHARVLAVDQAGGAPEERASELERALREYAAERASTDPEAVALGGGDVRLRNLAEYLLRTWPPRRNAPPGRRS